MVEWRRRRIVDTVLLTYRAVTWYCVVFGRRGAGVPSNLPQYLKVRYLVVVMQADSRRVKLFPHASV